MQAQQGRPFNALDLEPSKTTKVVSFSFSKLDIDMDKFLVILASGIARIAKDLVSV